MDFLPEVNLNEALLRKVSTLVEREHKATREIVEKLGEVEVSSAHFAAGYHSLYAYCTIGLGYSESAAMRRIKAARCARRYPAVLALLKERKLNLSTIGVLADVLNGDNADELLRAAVGKSTVEVRELVAQFLPVPNTNLRDQVSTVFVVRPKPQPGSSRDGAESAGGTPERPMSYLEMAYQKAFAPRPCRRDEWLEQVLRVSFVAAPEFSEKLESMRRLLSGKYYPGASLAEIFSEAMDCYIRHNCPLEKARRNLARKERLKQRRSGANSDSRHIPAEIRHEIFLRDGCQCTYVAPDGRRCESREHLEIDHIVPFAAGGTHESENLRLLCRAHNGFEAERFFGKTHMEQFKSASSH